MCDKSEFAAKRGPARVGPEIETESMVPQPGTTAEDSKIACLKFAMNELSSLKDAPGTATGPVVRLLKRWPDTPTAESAITETRSVARGDNAQEYDASAEGDRDLGTNGTLPGPGSGLEAIPGCCP